MTISGYTIGVDVDNTVVRSDIAWFEWCNSATHNVYVPTGERVEPYALAQLYPDLDPDYVAHFWRRENVYGDMIPVPDSVETLRELSKTNEIVFVSHVVGNHYESKRLFLEKWFPFMSGFIATQAKEYASVDVLIDDRVKVLNAVKMKGSATPILFKTVYEQCEAAIAPFDVLESWNKQEVYNVLSKIGEQR